MAWAVQSLYPARPKNISAIKTFKSWSVWSRVVYTVPFRSERPENLIPVCKPERETLLFHLEKTFRPFRRVSVIPANFGRYGHFGRYTFWGNWTHCSGLARLQLPHISDQLASSSSLIVPYRQCAEYVSVSIIDQTPFSITSDSLRLPLLLLLLFLLLSFPTPSSSYFSLSCREKHEEKWIRSSKKKKKHCSPFGFGENQRR